MESKQNSYRKEKKSGTMHSNGSLSNYQVESLLKEIKEKAGEVVRIAITDRTTIELPAHLSQAERDARVANYISLHKSTI
jgi:hypothetical protein